MCSKACVHNVIRTTVYSSSSRNCIFFKCYFSKIPQEKYEYGTILHSKSQKGRKKIENRPTYKNFMQLNIFEEGFFYCKIASKGSDYFLGKKSKLIIFHLNCTKPKQNCIVCIADCQTLKISPQICLIFNFQWSYFLVVYQKVEILTKKCSF